MFGLEVEELRDKLYATLAAASEGPRTEPDDPPWLVELRLLSSCLSVVGDPEQDL